MFHQLLRKVGKEPGIVVAITAIIFCSPAFAQVLPAPNASSVLILDTTVSGGLGSLEADKAVELGLTPVLASAAVWGTITSADFASYRALIMGDRTCTGVGAITPANANKAVWGPEVDGPVVLVGTDPEWHSSYKFGLATQGDVVTKSGIGFAASDPAKTGLYATLSCYYHGVAPATPVPFLDPLGAFTVTGVGCFNDAHIVAVHPALVGLTDASLSGWSCSVHEAFDSFPADFLPLAIAEGIPGAGSITFADGTFGIPYVLARDPELSPIRCGDGILDATEECDDGNTFNGDGCSAQCTIEDPTITSCPFSHGYWKNHEDVWPVDSLDMGGLPYSEVELSDVLSARVKGDASIILGHQLVAAKLNIANGSDPAPVSGVVADMDSLLSTYAPDKIGLGVKSKTSDGQAMTAGADVLDQYNNGLLTECE